MPAWYKCIARILDLIGCNLTFFGILDLCEHIDLLATIAFDLATKHGGYLLNCEFHVCQLSVIRYQLIV